MQEVLMRRLAFVSVIAAAAIAAVPLLAQNAKRTGAQFNLPNLPVAATQSRQRKLN